MAYNSSHSSGDSGSYENADVVTFLQRAGERYKEHLELLRRQRVEEERRIGPGVPRVSPFAQEWSEQTTRKSEAVEQRLHRLHQKRQEKLESSRERSVIERTSKEMEEVQKKLNLTEMGKHHGARDPVTVTEKFLDDHRKNLKKLAEESIKRELADVQSGPKITALASTGQTAERKGGLSIEDHLMLVEKQRRQKLYSAVEQKRDTPIDSFHPQITQRAQKLSQGSKPVVDRLYSVQRITPAYDETYERECTFQPHTNNKFFDYNDPHEGIPVHERLHDRSRSQLHFSEERERHRDPVRSLTFTPRISKTSQQIVDRKREQNHSASNMKSPTSRLYEQGTQSNSASTSGVEDVPTFTFTPRVDKKSVALYKKSMRTIQESTAVELHRAGGHADGKAEKKSARELMWEKKEREKKAFVDRLRTELEEREVEECTFAPNASCVASESVQRHRPADFARRENLWVLQRERALEQLKRDLEGEELEDCTFHPEVHDEVPLVSSSVPNAVGFEQHLQRLENARRRKAEEEQRHATPRAVKYHPGPTKPEPFLLGRDRERHRRQANEKPIAALRPPLNFDEWTHMRTEMDPPDPYHQGYNQPHEGVETHTYRSPRRGGAPTGSHHRHESLTDESTFVVHRPSDGRRHRGRQEPNPVEFVMNHHHAIMKSLESTGRRR